MAFNYAKIIKFAKAFDFAMTFKHVKIIDFPKACIYAMLID